MLTENIKIFNKKTVAFVASSLKYIEILNTFFISFTVSTLVVEHLNDQQTLWLPKFL